MQTCKSRLLLAVFVAVSIVGLARPGFAQQGSAQAEKAPLKIPMVRPNLYPAEANGREEIQSAIKEAGATNKRVLIVFGANWCGDCYALDYGFHRPKIEPLLTSNFQIVHVNVGQFDKNLDIVKQYKVPLEKGIPSLAVLDGRGGLLYSTPEFEKAHIMSEDDIIQFLNTWKPGAHAQKAGAKKVEAQK
ncbi:MAG TPA: thioredoxin family protein [Candidatus Angelobacter sp.]|nr:thioredoxin family protein [Candidatus Angelobacter sp.]